MSAPTLSVALCTYNGAAHLGEQLASIAEQTRRPDELVVLDDRSGDATLDVVRAFAAPFPVRFAVNACTLGSTRNFEAAVARCTGDLIALADQDDVWHPRKLERLESALAGTPGAAAAFSDARLVDGGLRPLGRTMWEEIGLNPAMRRELAAGRGLQLLMHKSVVTGATLLFRAEWKSLVLPIAPEAVHDAWIALLLSAVAPLVPVPESLVEYRQHGGNQIGAARPTWWGRVRAVRRPVAMASVPSFAAWVSAAHVRLTQHRGLVLDPGALARLGEHAEHLRLRAGLPTRRASRLGPVWREFRDGRYARFSNGVLSAVKDLAS